MNEKNAFCVKIHHKTSLKNLEFASDESNSTVNTGMVLFTITPSIFNSTFSVATQQPDRDTYLDYKTILDNGLNLALPKSKALQTNKGFIPCNWEEGEE